jgi:hypothetical protein
VCSSLTGLLALIDPVRKPAKPPGGHHGTEVPTRSCSGCSVSPGSSSYRAASQWEEQNSSAQAAFLMSLAYYERIASDPLI